jgi:aconitate hydratase
MPETLTHKIIRTHLFEGKLIPGKEIGLSIDQTLVQDATGTMVWQEFATFRVPQIKNRVCVTYVDHNLLQTGFENADDHLFLQSMSSKYGAVFSRPGNGISHFAHLERFDRPGETLLGSDSHTCSAGAMGMIAFGAGGAEVAAAMAGEPYYCKMPKVVKVILSGELPPWVSAKDVILELLRRLTVKGGVNKVMEYVGNGLLNLSIYERATICNMTQELGASSGVFPSDETTLKFLKAQGREEEWKPLAPDEGADYDEVIEIDLSSLEPLIAMPQSPDNVVPVREVEGIPVCQVAVGSCVDSSYRDLMIVSEILKDKQISSNIHMTLSPGSRQTLINLGRTDALKNLIKSGVRFLEIGCGPCIGLGAAPPSRGNSVRTFNRNFPGRSGTVKDRVWLSSPEVAAATALKGVISDPRSLGEPPRIDEPEIYESYTKGLINPANNKESVKIYTGPNIKTPPLPDPPLNLISGEVLLVLGDDISTDDILPGKYLHLRSNIPAISQWTFAYVDKTFPTRAKTKGGGFIVGGKNWGQGSSREHAAIAPMFLGVKAILAKSFARIHESNLVNFGIIPLRFVNPEDYNKIQQGDHLMARGVRTALVMRRKILIRNMTRRETYQMTYNLSKRQIDILLLGGLSRYLRNSIGNMHSKYWN